MDKQAPVLLTPEGVDYVLLDSGSGRKLERFGTVIVDRPEPQAVWARALSEDKWASAQAVFAPKSGDEESEGGNWETRKAVPERWEMGFNGLGFYGRLTPFRHLGCFPDQSPQWAWLEEVVKPGMKVLNLFGYTGVASLVAARAGAEVVHVDASKKAIGFGRENAALAGLEKAKIRWICDDALAFAAREGRRGNAYDIVLMDPPKYGRGPDGEKWEFFAGMPQLLADVGAVTNSGGFVWLTAYALRVSSVALGTMLQEAVGGTVTVGEFVSVDGKGRGFTNSMWARVEKGIRD